VASSAVPYQVAVFLGDGTGHLGDSSVPPDPLTTVATGTSPVDVVVGDLNRDGKLDLVTANAGSADSSVLLGAGDGTFTASSAAPIGGTPRRVRLLDLDRDGVLDLAVLDETGQRIVALRGRLALPPAFDTIPFLVGLADTPVGLAVADFDHDGRVDLWADDADVVGSVANFLARHDWQRDQPVLLPAALAPEGRDAVLRRLDGDGVRVTGLSIEQPTLDDVFLRHTGRRIREEAADQPLELGW